MARQLSISAAVGEALGIYGFLQLPLAMGVVNYSALARKIRPIVEEKLQKKVRLGAVIIAIQRTAAKSRRDKASHNLVEAVARTKLRIITGLCTLHIRNSSSAKAELSKKIGQLAMGKDISVFNAVVRSDEMLVIAPQSECYKFFYAIESRRPFENECEGNRSVITLILSKKALVTPGYAKYFLNELTYHGINIFCIFSTRGALSFVVADFDAALAYNRLSHIINECDRNLLAANKISEA